MTQYLEQCVYLCELKCPKVYIRYTMNINIFLLCYNESPLLPHIIKHYKKYMPSCKITICDNKSTDNSVEVARSHGCNVLSWDSNNMNNEDMKIKLRNNCWKHIQRGWIIMADMDECICITEDELLEETKQGTTILNIVGKDMIGESKTLDLTDIDLQEITKYIDNNYESKKLCFLREKITSMNYGPGSHNCNPVGEVKYSSKKYINKHMNFLGLNFLINKHLKRYQRSALNRSKGMSTHYKNNTESVKELYMKTLTNCKIMSEPW